MDTKIKNSKLEPAKYLKENSTNKFTWTITSDVPENFRERRVRSIFY